MSFSKSGFCKNTLAFSSLSNSFSAALNSDFILLSSGLWPWEEGVIICAAVSKSIWRRSFSSPNGSWDISIGWGVKVWGWSLNTLGNLDWDGVGLGFRVIIGLKFPSNFLLSDEEENWKPSLTLSRRLGVKLLASDCPLGIKEFCRKTAWWDCLGNLKDKGAGNECCTGAILLFSLGQIHLLPKNNKQFY